MPSSISTQPKNHGYAFKNTHLKTAGDCGGHLLGVSILENQLTARSRSCHSESHFLGDRLRYRASPPESTRHLRLDEEWKCGRFVFFSSKSWREKTTGTGGNLFLGSVRTGSCLKKTLLRVGKTQTKNVIHPS